MRELRGHGYVPGVTQALDNAADLLEIGGASSTDHYGTVGLVVGADVLDGDGETGLQALR